MFKHGPGSLWGGCLALMLTLTLEREKKEAEPEQDAPPRSRLSVASHLIFF